MEFGGLRRIIKLRAFIGGMGSLVMYGCKRRYTLDVGVEELEKGEGRNEGFGDKFPEFI
jgi:hypothetical protein